VRGHFDDEIARDFIKGFSPGLQSPQRLFLHKQSRTYLIIHQKVSAVGIG
jgi:hypothetical protein